MLERIKEAKELMIKTFKHLGAPEGFIDYTVEDEIYELECSLFRDNIKVNGENYYGHLVQISYFDNDFVSSEYNGEKCRYKFSKILYLFVNKEMVKLVLSNGDYYESLDGKYLAGIQHEDQFVELEELNWGSNAKFD